MPALAKPPVLLPRFVPHNNADAGGNAGAGLLSGLNPEPELLSRQSDTPARLAHDARNVLSGLMLYCELLAMPGVLNEPHGHYAEELEGIAQAATRILEKIMEVAAPEQSPAPRLCNRLEAPPLPTAIAIPLAATPVTDVGAELCRLRPLLAAIAGPAVKLSVASMPCPGQTALAVEDFTRILINLVRNAADAMPAGGHIGIAVQYSGCLRLLDSALKANDGAFPSPKPAPQWVLLTVSDDGPGIPEALRAQIFDLGFSTHKDSETSHWPAPRRRGMGLNIVRSLVEAAGGTVRTTASHAGGARFEISLPLGERITSGTCLGPTNGTFPADSRKKGRIECQ